MAEITKRETRNRGERRPVTILSPPIQHPSAPKKTKRKAQSPPRPQEPLKNRDPPGLPSSRQRQDLDLPDAEWKSVPESGVLAASLKLSMEKWRNGSCFEKYWVKNPVKKAHRDFRNPSTGSMIRLGSALMIIEPHSFEVILYSVKPPVNTTPKPASNKPPPPVTQPIPPFKPPTKNDASVQSGNRVNTVVSNPVPITTTSAAPKLTSIPSSQASIVPVTGQPPSPANTVKPAQSTNGGIKPPNQPPTDPASNNPVIQELASRASKDTKLKDLMKIVAQGSANDIQLKEFQRHIDDINRMLNAKTVPKPENRQTHRSSGNNTRQIQPMTWTHAITPNAKLEAGVQSHMAPHTKSKAVSSVKPDISAVVFEILSGTGDRYYIPRKSLLEFTEGTRLAVLSFLVHLKGTNASGGFYEDETEYCELITLKFLADRQGILDSLRRAVDPPDVVREHMENWAVKMSIAEKAYLTLRLRAIPEGEEARPQTAISVIREDAPKLDYEAPNSLFPLQRSTLVGKV